MRDLVTLARLGINAGEGYAKRRPDGSCEAYPDPKTGGDPWTVGYGNTGPNIGPGTVWTLEQAQAVRDARIQQFMTELDASIPWWRTLSPERGAVILEMAYNLGVPKLMGFHHMLAAAQAKDWSLAAWEMLNNSATEPTQWALDVKPTRANRLAQQMLSGVCIL